ncbi:MAG: DUF4388 domain-containing protein [Candidatus Obscuribacterales bacterium]|nr:DUF4388 domain-containing protein [Candidatus Obscuribacterales bacterium]
MFGNRRNEERTFNRLAKQSGLPTLKQLQEMLSDSLRNVGRTTELPFGDPPEEYALAAFKDRGKGDMHWALYRSDGQASMMLWDQVSIDPGYINQLITAQFPGFDLNRVALGSASEVAQGNTQTRDSGFPAIGFSSSNNSGAAYVESGVRSKARPTLEGDLENLQIPNLLQSISMSKSTGRLEVRSSNVQAQVMFLDGMPIHCVLGSLEGAAALIELIGWDDGQFRFFQGDPGETRTIKRRLDFLLMEGAALDDQFKSIKAKGIKETTFLIRKGEPLSETRLEEILNDAAGADMALQKQIYQMIDNRTRLGDILRRFNVTKADWVPVIFNFINCDLVSFVDELPEAPGKRFEINLDLTQARSVERMLTRQDTGIFNYPSLLWILEREYERWQLYGRPFSLILLDVAIRPQSPEQVPERLPITCVKELADRINRSKIKLDILAHYETFGLALVMPETDAQVARVKASKLEELIVSTALTGGMGGYPLMAALGVASLPEDCVTLGSLVGKARAELAKR